MTFVLVSVLYKHVCDCIDDPFCHTCIRRYIGVRSGMTEPERERRPTRFSARPPPRFATGTDFSLWIKRVELYIQEAGLPEEKKGAELVSLLEDEPFRIVSQLGLVSETVEYDAVKACLASHFSPDGVELEWQANMHVARLLHVH